MRSEDRPERAVLFVLQETLFPVRQKRSARIALRRNGRRCSGSPPQAENPAEQDSFYRKLFVRPDQNFQLFTVILQSKTFFAAFVQTNYAGDHSREFHLAVGQHIQIHLLRRRYRRLCGLFRECLYILRY